MNSGFRYHVVTIVGIFLALGIGLIGGSLFVSSPLIVQQTRAIRDLRYKLDDDISHLQGENQNYHQFVDSVMPILIHGKLSGYNVIVVQTGDFSDLTRLLVTTLKEAGATVLSTIAITSKAATADDATIVGVMSKLRSAHPFITLDRTGLWRVLAQSLVRGNGVSDLQILLDKGIIEADSNALTNTGCMRILVVGGSKEADDTRAQMVDAPLISDLTGLGATVVMAEPETAITSSVPALAGTSIATVDNAETTIGRCGVVFAFLGGPGNYGTKSSDVSLLPTPTATASP
ncbi:MAG: copper transporter [Armatimonadetes bacterium]|nr:copper transporter [Armatimonadota bacterium]